MPPSLQRLADTPSRSSTCPTRALEPETSSLSALCTWTCFPRIAPATCANVVPLETATNRSVPMECGPSRSVAGILSHHDDILVHEEIWCSVDRQDIHLILSNREWAILIWGVGIFLFLMARREIRSSVGQLL